MRFRAFVICCFVLARCAGAAEVARSVTGQFSAVDLGGPGVSASRPSVLSLPGLFIVNPTAPASAGDEMRVEPALAVISCEQIKQSLLLTLGLPDLWQGRINLIINPAIPEEQGTLLTGEPGPRGWNYELALPAIIKPRLLLRALVKAQLIEIANRSAGEQSAEIPDWLVTGMSARLQASSVQPLILQAQVTMVGNRVRPSGLGPVRELLRRRRPLTFQELSLPGPELLDADNYEFFAACSQLFVDQLLHLDDGRECLRQLLLHQLPGHLNWQTAFLEAYSRHFHQLLDVEKWWGLTCVNFGAADASARFSPGETWRKLQEALDVPVEVRLSAEELPVPAEYTLQEIIADWEPANAAPVLQRAAGNLALLRIQAAPEYSSLLDRYLATLESYVKQIPPDRVTGTSHHQVTLLASVRFSVCRDLDRLDKQRAEMRPKNLLRAARPPSRNAPLSPPETDSARN